METLWHANPNRTSRVPPFELGEARQFQGLTLVPLYTALKPRADYVGLDEAAAAGLTITELNEAGSVESLLYEGEELAGAKQNRRLERSILVAAGSKLEIPAKCVEAGCWAYRSRRFTPAPRASHPELRDKVEQRQKSRWASVLSLDLAGTTEFPTRQLRSLRKELLLRPRRVVERGLSDPTPPPAI